MAWNNPTNSPTGVGDAPFGVSNMSPTVYGDDFFARIVRMVRLHNIILDEFTFTDEEIEFTVKNMAYPRIWFVLKTARDEKTGFPIFHDPGTVTGTTFTGDEATFLAALNNPANNAFADSLAWVASAFAASFLTMGLTGIVDALRDEAKYLDKQANDTLDWLKQNICCDAGAIEISRAEEDTGGAFDNISFFFTPCVQSTLEANPSIPDSSRAFLYDRMRLPNHVLASIRVVVGTTGGVVFTRIPNLSTYTDVALQTQSIINQLISTGHFITVFSKGDFIPAKLHTQLLDGAPIGRQFQEYALGEPQRQYTVEVPIDRVTVAVKNREILCVWESINVQIQRFFTFSSTTPAQGDLDAAFDPLSAKATGETAQFVNNTSPLDPGDPANLNPGNPLFYQIDPVGTPPADGDQFYQVIPANTSLDAPSTDILFGAFVWEYSTVTSAWRVVERWPVNGVEEICYGTQEVYDVLNEGPHGVLLTIDQASNTVTPADTAAPELCEVNTIFFEIMDPVDQASLPVNQQWNTSYQHKLKTGENIDALGETVGNLITGEAVFKYRIEGPVRNTPVHNENEYAVADSRPDEDAAALPPVIGTPPLDIRTLPLDESIAFRVPAGSGPETIAQAFSHSLFNYYKINNVMGAIIQDPAGVTLVNNEDEVFIRHLVVEFTEVPPPILLSTGTYNERLGTPSNARRSITICTTPAAATQANVIVDEEDINDGRAAAYLADPKKSDRHQYVADRLQSIYGFGNNRYTPGR